LQATLVDITERKRNERYLAVESTTAQALASSVSEGEAISRTLQSICETLDWVYGAFWEVDAPANVLGWRFAWHSPAIDISHFEGLSRERPVPCGVGLPGRVWEQGKPAWIPDVLRDENFPRARFAAYDGLHAAFAFPILAGRQVLGVMEFFSREIRQPDELLLSMLVTVGSQVGLFIERKRAEEEVRESEARKRAVLEGSLDAIISVDREGRIVEWNPSAEKLFRYSQAEALGRLVTDLITPSRLRAAHNGILASFLSTSKMPVFGKRVEMPGLRADGTEFCMEMAIIRMPVGGSRIFTAFIRDITDLKETQQALLQSARLAAIGETVSVLAHESRNALQRIQAGLELLAPEVEDLPRARRVKVFIEEAQTDLSRLFEELQTFAAPVLLERPLCDVGEIMHSTWQQLIGRRAGRQVRFDEKSDGLDLWAEVDPFRLGQVFRNILENALDACADPVEIRARWSEARIDGRPALRIVIRDNGPGLGPEQAARIFKPFYTTKVKGTGLGLAIAQRIVEAHGGCIEVGRGGGIGAEFVLLLPRRLS
jgi:PAS domain S-box-containing protein